MRIYLDMDGVLMDYDSHILGWLNPPWTGRTYHHLPLDQWTPEEVTNDLRYKNAMADRRFWRTMRPMADAYELWDFCRPLLPCILTATPDNAVYAARCAADKLFSIHSHFDSLFPVRNFHAVLRSEKRKFAGSHENGDRAVLVDDMLPNCQDWEGAGGIAILHRNAKDTIRQLREILHAQ
jgi:hypothetical protein